MNYDRVVFLYPNTMNHFHNNVINGALNIDLVYFCQHMVASAQQWLSSNEKNDTVLRNYEKLMKVYPDGLTPYISGFPIIG